MQLFLLKYSGNGERCLKKFKKHMLQNRTRSLFILGIKKFFFFHIVFFIFSYKNLNNVFKAQKSFSHGCVRVNSEAEFRHGAFNSGQALNQDQRTEKTVYEGEAQAQVDGYHFQHCSRVDDV